MPLSADQLRVIRTWVGDEPTTSYLDELYLQYGLCDDVVRASLRRKIALLAEQPSSISLPGGLSVSNGQQLISLQQTLRDFNNVGGTGLDTDGLVGLKTAKLVRTTNVR